MLPVRYDSSQRQPDSLVLATVVLTPAKPRSILGLLPILFFCLAASRKPSTSTADANQPTPTSTDHSTPTLQVPALVAARTPQAPPPQPPALPAHLIWHGTVLAVRLQPAWDGNADRQEEDDLGAIWAQAGRVNRQTLVPAGKRTAIGSGANVSALAVSSARGGKGADWMATHQVARERAVSDRAAVSSTARLAVHRSAPAEDGNVRGAQFTTLVLDFAEHSFGGLTANQHGGGRHAES